MLPSPRANSSVNWFEVIVKTAIVFGISWFLISNMLTLSRGPEEAPELKAADQALKANDVAKAQAQFDKLIVKNPKNTVVYVRILILCGTNRSTNLLNAYAQQAQSACKDAPKADQAELYRALAGAYLDCGGKAALQALPAAEKAYALEPDSLDSMNSLAYTISETTSDPVRLQRAQDLILHALTELNSKTGVANRPLLQLMYNDTYAWVLYKQGINGLPSEAPGRFARAANLLIDVINGLPDELEGTVAGAIYYHIGAVYGKIGQIAQARNMLTVALQYDPGNLAAQQALATLPAIVASLPQPSTVTADKPTAPNQQNMAPAFTPLLTPSSPIK